MIEAVSTLTHFGDGSEYCQQYIPASVARDSAFPLIPGEQVRIQILPGPGLVVLSLAQREVEIEGVDYSANGRLEDA